MKNKFIKSTIILIIGGFISKLLTMFIRIILTRKVGSEGIGLYMLVLPTFVLFITIANLGMPLAISKLVGENKRNNKKLVLSIIPVILLYNLVLMLVVILIAPFIAKVLLKNERVLFPIMVIGLTLPFITISDLIRGYYFGKQKMVPYVISNLLEQLVRLFFIIFIIPKLLRISLELAISGVVLINLLSEFASIVVLILLMPKNIKIKKEDFKYNKKNLSDSLEIGIPSTGSRLIGTIGAFLEPIILTFGLSLSGYSSLFITKEYGIINGYVLPLIMLPSFFSFAISNALLPVISNAWATKKYQYARSKVKQAILISLVIGIPCTLALLFLPKLFLNLLYKTDLGINYLRVMAPIFILLYIQGPLTTTLQAINKAKKAMYGTLMGMILRCGTLLVCSFLKMGLWSLVIATCINVIFVTIHHLYYVMKYLFRTSDKVSS